MGEKLLAMLTQASQMSGRYYLKGMERVKFSKNMTSPFIFLFAGLVKPDAEEHP